MAVSSPVTESAFGRQIETFPRLPALRSPSPELNAVVKKLVSDAGLGDRFGTSTNTRTHGAVRPLDLSLLQHLSGITGSNVQDASSLFQLLPDTELAMQILVSSILSPKDLVTSELTYKVNQAAFNSPVAGMLLDCVKDYFENTYKIKDLNPQILQDCLFFTGSYPLVILPENAIDDIINSGENVSTEAFSQEFNQEGGFRSLGWLGEGYHEPANEKDAQGNTPVTAKVALESMLGTGGQTAHSSTVAGLTEEYRPYLQITDNFNALKLPFLKEKLREQRSRKILASAGRTFSFEARPHDESREANPLYRDRRYQPMPVVAVKAQSSLQRPPIGHPLVMKLPAESVVPVHMPANPEKHLGYFLLLDETGNPLARALESDYYTDLSSNINAHNDMVSQLIATTRRMEMGRETARSHDTKELQRIFDELVEQDFLARLKNGVYGENAEVASAPDIYRIMLARTLKKMVTQVLYVPNELMTYIAFDYNRYGIGQSLIQNSKIIGGIRAMMLFANTMAAIKNSVGREQLNIQLSEKDPQPTKTVQFLIHEYAKTRQASYPLGASNPIDIISFLQNAAVNVAVTGNTGFPEVKFDVEDKQSNQTRVDKELEDSLRDRYLMALGLSPETVVAGANTEFATTIVTQNLLLTKRVLVYQGQLCTHLRDFIQKYTRNSGTLMDQLRQIIQDHLKELEAQEAKDAKERAELEKAAQAKEEEHAAETQDKQDDLDSFGSEARVEVSNKFGALKESKNALGFRTYKTPEGHDYDVEELLLEFLDAIEVSLPAPDTGTLENQMKALDTYSDALEKGIDAYLNTSFLTQTGLGETEGLVEEIKAGIKAYFIRQWLRTNNVLPELDNLVMTNDEGEPELDLLELEANHVGNMGKSILGYIRTLLKAKAKIDAKYEAISEKFGETIAEGGGNADFGGDNDETSGGDTDEGLDLDLGGEETGETEGGEAEEPTNKEAEEAGNKKENTEA